MTTKRKGATKAAKRRKSAKKSKRSARTSGRASLSIAANTDKSVKERIAAMAQSPLAVCQNEKNLHSLLNVLRNTDEPLKVRLFALQTLQAASFSVVEFAPCRPDYVATLREISNDPNPEIRERALGVLARDKDGFAQEKLLAGLRTPDKALVPPEKALQLLSHDPHSDAYSAARNLVNKSPSETIKREAVRLLAADAKSTPLFEKLLRDKDETREIRQISASALQALQPEKLQSHAREIVLDTSEHNDIQATSLTALTNFGDEAALAEDKQLLESVEQLEGGAAASVTLQQSARRFLKKFRR